MLVLALLFLVVPIAEIYVIVQASHAFGFGNTLGALIVIALLGSWLVKREGTKVWARFVTQINAGKVPSNEIADGVCLLFAGALMLTPGFLTDVVAVLLIIPPTRALFRRWLIARYSGRGRVVSATHGRRPAVGGTTIDTTATETPRQHDGQDRGRPPRGELDS